MILDYREWNKVVPLIHAAVSNIVTTLDTLTTVLQVYDAVPDLASTFVSMSLGAEPQDQFASTRRGKNGPFEYFPVVTNIAVKYIMGW